jgi:hypothetical protein
MRWMKFCFYSFFQVGVRSSEVTKARSDSTGCVRYTGRWPYQYIAICSCFRISAARHWNSSVRPSVRPSVRTKNSRTAERIFMKFYVGEFFKICLNIPVFLLLKFGNDNGLTCVSMLRSDLVEISAVVSEGQRADSGGRARTVTRCSDPLYSWPGFLSVITLRFTSEGKVAGAWSRLRPHPVPRKKWVDHYFNASCCDTLRYIFT